MKPLRTVLALVGLAAILLTYTTRNLYFLIVAVVALFAGFYLMGANRRDAGRKGAKNQQDEKRGVDKSSMRKKDRNED